MLDNQFEIIDEKKNRGFMLLVALACFLSNISQLPFLVSAGMTQKLNMPMWIVLLLYIFLKKKIRVFYSTFKIFFAICSVFVLILLSSIVTNNLYFNSSVLQCLILSFFIYCLGTFVGEQFSDKDLKIVSMSYVISATIVAFSIYVEYFSVGFDITSRQYAYASKNSISQIIFTAIVILMFIHFDKFRIFNLLKIVVILSEVILLIFLKSRATIVGFAICLLYIILGKQFNRKIKYLLTVVVVIGTLALLMNENLFDMDKDTYYDKGYEYVSGARIKSWKKGGHGLQTFREVLQNSSNPGFVEIGRRLGKKRLYQYVQNFGLTEKTGIDLPGESCGIMFDYKNFHELEQATVAFGQGISVTPLQLVTAICACVYGGYLLQPHNL